MLFVSRAGCREGQLHLQLPGIPEGRRMISSPSLRRRVSNTCSSTPQCWGIGRFWECKPVNRIFQLEGTLVFRMKALNKEKLENLKWYYLWIYNHNWAELWLSHSHKVIPDQHRGCHCRNIATTSTEWYFFGDLDTYLIDNSWLLNFTVW